MIGRQSVTVYFHRNDDRRDRVPLTHCTVVDAKEVVREILSTSDGGYTKAEIYRGKRLIETVEMMRQLA